MVVHVDINEIVCFIESCSLLSGESSVCRGYHDIFGSVQSYHADKLDYKTEKKHLNFGNTSFKLWMPL